MGSEPIQPEELAYKVQQPALILFYHVAGSANHWNIWRKIRNALESFLNEFSL